MLTDMKQVMPEEWKYFYDVNVKLISITLYRGILKVEGYLNILTSKHSFTL